MCAAGARRVIVAEFLEIDSRRSRHQGRAQEAVEIAVSGKTRGGAVVERDRRMGGGRATKALQFRLTDRRAAAIDDDPRHLARQFEGERAGMGIV